MAHCSSLPEVPRTSVSVSASMPEDKDLDAHTSHRRKSQDHTRRKTEISNVPLEVFSQSISTRRRNMSNIENSSTSMIDERFKLKEVDGPPGFFMNKMQRNPISGKCYLDDVSNERDFCLVNLMHHDMDEVEWGPSELKNTEYLYTPHPLVARNWLYHELCRSNMSGNLTSSTHSLRSRMACALSLKVNDLNQCGCYGAGSPAKIFSFMLFSTGIIEDFTSLWLVFFSFILTISLSKYCNSLAFYRSSRLMTLPLRWLVLFWNLSAAVDIPAKFVEDPPKYHVALALLINVGLCIYDFVEDLASWYSGAEETSWKVVRILPGKVMVCIRVCKANAPLGKYQRLEYPAAIVGSDKQRVVVIAEIAGMLFMLKPLVVDDVDKLTRWCRATQSRPRTYCTRTFTSSQPTAASFDELGLPISHDASQAAKREALLHRISLIELKHEDRRNKALENESIVKVTRFKRIVDSLLKGFKSGAVWDQDDFAETRERLLTMEILEDAMTMKSIRWEEMQRRRTVNPYRPTVTYQRKSSDVSHDTIEK